MEKISFLQILNYSAVIVLFLGLLSKAIKYFTMPINLRWELYPIPHEKGRPHGGSYFEDLNWWTKPREKTLIGQLKFMIPEILFIKALYHDNRKLWIFSFPFHFGLYLYIGGFILLLIGSVLTSYINLSSDLFIIKIVQSLAIIFFGIGFILGIFGSIGLLIRRSTSEELEGFTSPKDFFNLIFILLIMASGLISLILYDKGLIAARVYINGLITFNPIVSPNPMFIIHIVLLSLFLIYFPFTHMTHMFAKYLMWDKIKWEDEPNLKGSAIEARVDKALGYVQDWSAPHIHTGTKWSETATKGVEENEKK
ncbi:MAG: respiratory nitrate reductase subunit gamma [Thermodesulfobacteriota bacterium]|nr:respiratory nitrate reductase subunit gamma [Thermodesulfobacteriota bacterium]